MEREGEEGMMVATVKKKMKKIKVMMMKMKNHQAKLQEPESGHSQAPARFPIIWKFSLSHPLESTRMGKER